MDAVRSSEMILNFYRSTRRHISDDSTSHIVSITMTNPFTLFF
jgi:hypothetical protein